MENRNVIPAVCIVGRPNVGKSSLFNQILGERKAVVFEQSGTTRDRVEAVISLGGLNIKIVDTGGYVAGEKDKLSMQVKDQIYSAMEESAVMLMVTDTQDGITAADREVAEILRKFSKPVILAANKADNNKLSGDAVEFYQLGLGEPVIVSCAQKTGIRAIRTAIRGLLKGHEVSGEDAVAKRVIKIAIVGRPNVGKSSLVNNMLATNRVIVSDIPGTTRDSIDTHFAYDGQDYLLIDTAGIRHKRKVKTPIDAFSIMRSKESIKKADVVLLLLDATEGIANDDIGILKFIEESGKACLILVNKWDLAARAEEVTKGEYEKHLVYAANELSKFPISFISAKTGENVRDVFGIIKVLDANLDTKVSTPFLNRLFKLKDPAALPIPRNKKRPNFLYMIQKSARPIEFTYFVNDPAAVLGSHISFMENQLRENLPLKGIAIKINIRKSRKGQI